MYLLLLDQFNVSLLNKSINKKNTQHFWPYTFDIFCKYTIVNVQVIWILLPSYHFLSQLLLSYHNKGINANKYK